MFKAAEPVPGAGLDLDEDDGARAVGRDQIQFAVATPPVALQDPPTHVLQVLHSDLLPEGAEFLPAGSRHEASVGRGSDGNRRTGHDRRGLSPESH